MKKTLLTIILFLTAYSPCHAEGNDLSISFNEKKSVFRLKNNTKQTIFYEDSFFFGRPPKSGYLELAIRVNGKRHEKYCAYVDSFDMPRKLSLKPGSSASISIALDNFEAVRCIEKGQKYQISLMVEGKKNLESNRIEIVGTTSMHKGTP